jgi:hypothetical protein
MNKPCPACQKNGQKSTVHEGMSTVTLLSTSRYWDQEGVEHYYDPNIWTTRYSCSNGHSWTEHQQRQHCEATREATIW